MSGIEHHIEVAKTARYWTLGEVAAARELWFVLHGYKQLARRFLRRFQPIDDGSRLIVAPEALSRFYVSTEAGRHGSTSVVGATWMTREDREREIDDYVRYLDRLAEHTLASLPHPEVPITVLGFSQGVATATRWVTLGGIRPTRLLLWGDFTPPDLPLDRAVDALSGVDVVLVRGRQDPAISERLDEEESERLAGAGIEVRRIEYEGGHDVEPEALLGVAVPLG